MKKKSISALAVALTACLLMSSCGTMTKKKKPRFGGCQVTMMECPATDKVPSAAWC